VMKLMPDGITVTELAPGVDLERDVLAMADIPLKVSPSLRTTDETLFQPEPVGFNLSEV
jgi:propionate CoA-transferase